jgi:hypothetical protein
MGLPSLRSGVAVRPSSTRGRTALTKASKRSAARRWHSSTTTVCQWSAPQRATSSRLVTLSMVANRWSKRSGCTPPVSSSPKAWSRSTSR